MISGPCVLGQKHVAETHMCTHRGGRKDGRVERIPIREGIRYLQCPVPRDSLLAAKSCFLKCQDQLGTKRSKQDPMRAFHTHIIQTSTR